MSSVWNGLPASVTTPRPWQGLLVFLVIDAFCINAIHWWCLLPEYRYEACLWENVCLCVCGNEVFNTLKSQGGEERVEHPGCFLSAAVQGSWSKVSHVWRGGRSACVMMIPAQTFIRSPVQRGGEQDVEERSPKTPGNVEMREHDGGHWRREQQGFNIQMPYWDTALVGAFK